MSLKAAAAAANTMQQQQPSFDDLLSEVPAATFAKNDVSSQPHRLPQQVALGTAKYGPSAHTHTLHITSLLLPCSPPLSRQPLQHAPQLLRFSNVLLRGSCHTPCPQHHRRRGFSASAEEQQVCALLSGA
jgi:hypothetical protein